MSILTTASMQAIQDQATDRPTVDVWAALFENAKARSAIGNASTNDWFDQLSEMLTKESPAMGIEEAKAALPIFFVVTPFLFARGMLPLALAVADSALELSLRHKLQEFSRQAYNVVGVIHMELGAGVTAMENFSQAVSIARALNDALGEAKVWANVAATANHEHRYGETIVAATRALQLIGNHPAYSGIRMQAYQCIAYALTILRRYEEGAVKIEQAYDEADTAKTTLDAAQMVTMATARAAIYLELNNITEAEKSALDATLHAKRLPNTPSALEAELCCYMVEGRRDGVANVEARLKGMISRTRSGSSLRKEIYLTLSKLYRDTSRDQSAMFTQSFFKESRQGRMSSVLKLLPILYHVNRGSGESAISLSFDSMNEDNDITWKETSDEQNRDMLESLAFAAEIHDDATGRHAYRVGKLSALLAIRMGASEEDARELELAARLHDVGKILTPEEILQKPSALTTMERREMERHTIDGVKILHGNNHPLTRRASGIALCHHENWDGSGYPEGLIGYSIPMDARITSLADVFDALTNARPYKQAWTVWASIKEITKLRGEKFQPELTDAFVGLVNDLLLEHGEDGIQQHLAQDWESSRIINNSRAIMEVRSDDISK